MKEYITFGMGWEKSLGDFYKKYFEKTLDKFGFELYAKQEGPGMGAAIQLAGHSMIFKIVNDKSQYFVSIGNEIGKREYWDLQFLMAYFKLIDDNIPAEHTEVREKVLCDTFNWENYDDNAKYFSAHFERIKQLFQSDNFEIRRASLNKVVDELLRYRKERWSKR
jgi:hypothetical protein